jgi:hypothetical protein
VNKLHFFGFGNDVFRFGKGKFVFRGESAANLLEFRVFLVVGVGVFQSLFPGVLALEAIPDQVVEEEHVVDFELLAEFNDLDEFFPS